MVRLCSSRRNIFAESRHCNSQRNILVGSRDDYPVVSKTCRHVRSDNGSFYEDEDFHTEILRLRIIEAEGLLKEDKAAKRRLKVKFIHAKVKLSQLKRQYRIEEEKRFAKMYGILYKQVQAYHNAIPPVCHNLVETDDQIGEYQVFECIGEGAFAKVYLCQHVKSGSKYAIKCYDKSKIDSVAELANLGREIQVLSSTVHDNVLECVDVLHASNHIYLIMELGCCDLYDYQKKWNDQMTESVYQTIVRGIIQGLECLHHVGIAHLDLKPENILISRDCHPSELTSKDVKICDFGLCLISDAPMDDIVVPYCVGTPGFMSPELMLDLSNVEGRQCDMFSLGMLLLELMEGTPKNWFRLCNVHFKNEGAGRQELTYDLKDELMDIQDCGFLRESGHDLIRRLLIWDPESRYSALEALMHPWVMESLSDDESSVNS